MKGINDLMKQAQQMQEKMQKMQEEAAAAEVTGESGAGMVKVLMTGRYDVRKVTIDPGLFSGDSLLESSLLESKEVLEDLLAAAVNDAVRKVEQRQKDTMGSLTEGMQLPPGFKLPF